ncbi:MAG: CoA transferase [Desulfobacterales bacterium]|nr:CoA transferase [Desulfobacterales bacterium]
MGPISGDQSHNLLKAIGREGLIEEQRFDNRTKREQRVDEIDGIIPQWAKQKAKKKAVEQLLNKRVPSGPGSPSGCQKALTNVIVRRPCRDKTIKGCMEAYWG